MWRVLYINKLRSRRQIKDALKGRTRTITNSEQARRGISMRVQLGKDVMSFLLRCPPRDLIQRRFPGGKGKGIELNTAASHCVLPRPLFVHLPCHSGLGVLVMIFSPPSLSVVSSNSGFSFHSSTCLMSVCALSQISYPHGMRN